MKKDGHVLQEILKSVQFGSSFRCLLRPTGVWFWFWFYLHCPVMGQLGLFLHFLLQVAVGFCLFGPDRGGPEAAVVTSRVTLVEGGTQLRVHGHHEHTCGEAGPLAPEQTGGHGSHLTGHSQQPSGLISAFCVYTWEMSASRRHSTSAVTS